MSRTWVKKSRVRSLTEWQGIVIGLFAALMAATPMAAATVEVFVSPTAPSTAAPYDTWDTAFTDLQDALDYVAGIGSPTTVLHLAGQPFSANADGNTTFTLENATNVTVRGGYEGVSGGAGNEAGNWNPDTWTTTVARAIAGPDGRVLIVGNASNVVFEAITFRDGQISVAAAAHGGGVLVTDSHDIVFDSCQILDNSLENTGGTSNLGYGGGLALVNSTATVTNSLVAGNQSVRGHSHGTFLGNFGGGVSVDGSSRLTVLRSIVRENQASAGQRDGACGGGLYVAAGGELDVRESVIVDNIAYMTYGSTVKPRGGGIYNLGTARLRNVLVARNYARNTTSWAHTRGDGIHAEGAASVTVIENCTIVDNYFTTGPNSVGVYCGGGTMAITNTVVWGHDDDLANFRIDPDRRIWPDVWYSVIGSDTRNEGWQGCFTADPLFADTDYYHLQSTEGHWENGTFDGGVFGDAGGWTTAVADSPLIGRGVPDANGNRINIGAYGGTEVAAQSPAPTAAPTVANPGAQAWGHRTAWLQGNVTDTGGEFPAVSFSYWETADPGTTNTVDAGYASGVFRVLEEGLEPDTEYRYVVNASNSFDTITSAEAVFTTHAATGVDLYVSTNGNHTAGTNWVTAYRELATALAIAESGDRVYLAGQEFADIGSSDANEVFRLLNATNVVVRGGYEGDSGGGAAPGARNPATWPTTLALAPRFHAPVSAGRVLHVAGSSNVVFESLTFRDGRVDLTGSYRGGGLLFENSHDIVIDDCSIVENVLWTTTDGYGGGLALVSSSATMTNALLADNTSMRRSGTTVTGNYGGGAAVDGTSRLTVLRSMVRDNIATATSSQRNGTEGGAFHVAAGGHLEIYESAIVGNVAHMSYGSSVKPRGGAIYNAGMLRLRNVLLAANYARNAANDAWTQDAGDAIHAVGAGSVTIIENCTIADNFYDPELASESIGIHRVAGSVAITNSIVVGHDIDLGNFVIDGAGYWPDVWYSCIGDPRNDGHQGSLTVDPLFVDRTHYHLQSTIGHWTNGYFDGGVFGDDGDWTVAGADSPLIDRGHPDSDWSREPDGENGEWINIGAYGNTPVAAKSLGAYAAPTVVNPGAQIWGRSTVRLHGNITDSGGALPEVHFLYWIDGDTTTNSIAVGYTEGEFQLLAAGLEPGTEYRYLIRAVNSAGTTHSAEAAFTTQPATPIAVYLSTDGDNTAGTSWNTAYRGLQDVLAFIQSDDTLYLAGQRFEAQPLGEDIFLYRFNNLSNVVVRGGYEGITGSPGNRDPAVWPTELARDMSPGAPDARILYVSGSSNVVFESLVVRDGYLDVTGSLHGGGILIENSHDIVFEDCSIIENILWTSSNGYGGGLGLVNSTAIVSNSLITDNVSRRTSGLVVIGNHGGGASVDGSSRLTVTRSIVRDNVATCASVRNGTEGGGFYVAAGGELDMSETAITGNRALMSDGTVVKPRGGAIYNAGTVRLRSVLLAGNYARNAGVNSQTPHAGDGIHTAGAGSVTILENATIADNYLSPVVLHHDSIGIFRAAGSVAVTNSIVWGHDIDLSNLPENAGVLLNVSHSMFETHDTGDPMHGVNGCITAEAPVFDTQDEQHPYRLTRGSPGIDAGINHPWMADARDLAGLPRVMVSVPSSTPVVDMGAYEVLPLRGSIFLVR